MEMLIIVVGLIMLIIGLICLCTFSNRLAFIFGVIGGYIISGGILMYQESHKPTAMDVYQGKTTLEITYKDGEAVDSVVVFK